MLGYQRIEFMGRLVIAFPPVGLAAMTLLTQC
jgi:hypothetical protein